MDDEFPEVSFAHVWRGYEGRLLCDDDEISGVSHFVIRGVKFRPDQSWSLEFSVPGDHHAVQTQLNACEAPKLRFVGTTYSGQQVEASLLNTEPPSVPVESPPPEHHFRASATQLDVGVGELPETPTEQHAEVVLTEHALTREEYDFLLPHPSGALTPFDLEEDEEPDLVQEPLCWPTRFGQGELWLRYAWEYAFVEGRRSRVRVPEPRLEIEVPEARRTADVGELLEGIVEDTRWLLRLLSLFSRQHVRILEMRVTSSWNEGRSTEARSSRRLWSRTPSNREDFLDAVLRPGAIPAEGLEELKDRIDGLPYRESVSSTIGFLVEAFRAEFVEGQWAAAFTALETMVNAIGDAHGFTSPVEGGEFYRLRAKLEEVIETYEARDEEIDESDRQHLVRMLGALRRAPFEVRAARVVEETDIEWNDLWPPGTSLEEAVGEAYDRRSDLVHTGQIPDERDWFVDQFRMHALAERLVLAAIGLPEDWLRVTPYRHCAELPQHPI